MPVTKSAKKALRQSRKKQQANTRVKTRLQTLLRRFKKQPTKKLLSQAQSALAKAAKKNIIHPNKAARLKSQLAQKLPQ